MLTIPHTHTGEALRETSPIEERIVDPEPDDVSEISDDQDNEGERVKPTVIVISRVHPGDANTSFIVQGVLTSNQT